MTVRLQNKGLRKITFGHGKDDFLPKDGVGVFTDKLGASLLRLYPNELVDIDNLQAQFDHTAVKDFSAGEKAETVKAEKSKPEPRGKGKKAADKDPEDDDEQSEEDKLAAAFKDEK